MMEGDQCLRNENNTLRSNMTAGFKSVHDKIDAHRTEIAKLSERMARLEGTMDALKDAFIDQSAARVVEAGSEE